MPSGLDVSSGVWSGIGRLLLDYASLAPGDDVVVAYTPDVKEAVSWVCLAVQLMGYPLSLVPMRSLSDSGFRDRLRTRIPESRSTSGKCVLLVFEWETMSHNQTIRDVLHGHLPEQRQIVRCINTGATTFVRGLNCQPAELSARNASLLYFLMGKKSAHITTPSGTDLSVELDDSKYGWISNRGMSELGRMVVVPAGEIATFPARTDGVLVAEYAVHVNCRFEGDVRLEKSPVTIEISDSRIVDYRCSNRRILSQLDAFFAMENARRVGELGFGTDPAKGEPVPENFHINERRLGVHIGFGQHNQEDHVAGYQALVHVDLISAGGDVTLDDGVSIELENVPFIDKPHPSLLQEVDIFSPDIVPPDCCGLVS
ncbi:MAG: hypothetical protein JW384_00301 [Nitrosomonadaceae bacterium]|nr:hypothetical protein [Nitrosomonadaceae bacterium]